jgi:hypothetical protein
MKTRFAASLMVIVGVPAMAVLMTAQTPTPAPALKLTATSDNVSSAGEVLKINLVRWSTDAERDQFVAAWSLAGSARGGGGGGGRGARGGGTPAAAPAVAPIVAPVDTTVPELPPDPAAAAAPAAARGGGGRGGGGGGRGGGGANNPPPTPASSLLTALQNAPVAGYIWTSEVTGYAIRYAYKLPLPTGGQRIILATDRRLGAATSTWKPKGAATPTDYEFTVMELRLFPKGDGEGKASLTGKVAVEAASKTIALESYDTLPVVFKAVKPQ